MEMDTFFNQSRWTILEIISREPSSPLEISQKIGTSVAFVSQQLKLLEAANIVQKQKTGLVEKGKPRSIYSVTSELAYLTSLINGNPIKKLLYLREYHKIILRIWLIENPEHHYTIEKIYWQLEPEIEKISGIFFDSSSTKTNLYIISEDKKVKLKVSTMPEELKKEISIKAISEKELSKMNLIGIHPIYDPSFLLGRQMKGGIVKGEK